MRWFHVIDRFLCGVGGLLGCFVCGVSGHVSGLLGRIRGLVGRVVRQ